MTTRQRTVRRPGAPRRALRWADDTLNSDVASNSEVISQLNANLNLTQKEDATLVRSIICVMVIPETPVVNNVDNNQRIAMGIGVVAEEAFGAGGSALANPGIVGEEPLQGWVWRCQYWVPHCSGVNYPALLVEKDIRAGRKLASGIPFLRFGNNAGTGAAFNVRFVGFVRTLYMLA